MRLTEGRYDLETGYFYIHQYEVESKPKTYKSEGSIFYKEDEECVRLIRSGDTKCPRLEVFTMDVVNPVEKLQSLLKEWTEKRMFLVPFKTKVSGRWQFDKDMIRQYMESINLDEFNLSDADFPTKDDVEKIYAELTAMDRPHFYHLQTAVSDMLENMREELELESFVDEAADIER